MQKVILFDDLLDVSENLEPEVFRYIGKNQIESFECFDTFNLLAFDWYDIHSERTELSKILIYLDKNNLFFICKDEEARRHCVTITEALHSENVIKNEQMLCHFFIRLFRGDMEYLEQFESQINNTVTNLLSNELNFALNTIIIQRQELLRLKNYYEQIDTIFDEIVMNDNGLLSHQAIKHMKILGARTDRYLNKVCNLQELVSQMQETYQAQLSIQQNDLMKFFTVITAIFLPLTLLVGWYGMNFVNMPELHWQYGYLSIILISIAIVIGLIWYFKYKKWL